MPLIFSCNILMTNRKPARTRKTSSSSRRRRSHRHAHFPVSIIYFSWFQKGPRWAWIIGAVGVLALYIWVFYYFFVGPTGFRWRALYGDAKYPGGYEIHGIDVSRYQGDIDWHRLRSNAIIDGCPLRFVFIKGTEGSSRVDPNFNDNFEQAREYGFVRGVYHFWSNKSSARDQAYYFLKNVHLVEGDLPPVLDIEHKPKDKSVEDFQQDVLTWLHIVEDKYHVKPIIYTYFKFKERYLSAPVFDDYPYWIAHYYVDKVEYKGDWKFWQHTDTGVLPGINGNVDLNIYNGSYYDLMQLTIGGQSEVEIAE